jgi:hypothetical protein
MYYSTVKNVVRHSSVTTYVSGPGASPTIDDPTAETSERPVTYTSLEPVTPPAPAAALTQYSSSDVFSKTSVELTKLTTVDSVIYQKTPLSNQDLSTTVLASSDSLEQSTTSNVFSATSVELTKLTTVDSVIYQTTQLPNPDQPTTVLDTSEQSDHVISDTVSGSLDDLTTEQQTLADDSVTLGETGSDLVSLIESADGTLSYGNVNKRHISHVVKTTATHLTLFSQTVAEIGTKQLTKATEATTNRQTTYS